MPSSIATSRTRPTRPDGTSPRGHYGLTGMQERARLAGVCDHELARNSELTPAEIACYLGMRQSDQDRQLE